MMTMDSLLLFTILLPLLAAVGILIFSRYPNMREGITIVTAIVLLLEVINVYDYFQGGQVPAVGPFQVLPGLDIAFNVEPLGMLFALIASILKIINSI